LRSPLPRPHARCPVLFPVCSPCPPDNPLRPPFFRSLRGPFDPPGRTALPCKLRSHVFSLQFPPIKVRRVTSCFFVVTKRYRPRRQDYRRDIYSPLPASLASFLPSLVASLLPSRRRDWAVGRGTFSLLRAVLLLGTLLLSVATRRFVSSSCPPHLSLAPPPRDAPSGF